jgi:hypothetical protein
MTYYLFGRHRVQDFAAWQRAFEAGAPGRAACGSTGARYFVSASDANDVFILVAFDSLEGARRYADDPQAAPRMRAVGVLDPVVREVLHAVGETVH